MSANPKQQYGDKKLPLHWVPPTAINYMAMAMAEGGRKYGPFNFRETDVEAMTYVGATMRHLMAYIDGEYIDPESGNPHLAHAMASLGILADGHENNTIIDNRPKKGSSGRQFAEFADRKAAAHTPPTAYAHTDYADEPEPTMAVVDVVRFVNPLDMGLPLSWLNTEVAATYDEKRDWWTVKINGRDHGLLKSYFELGYVTFV